MKKVFLIIISITIIFSWNIESSFGQEPKENLLDSLKCLNSLMYTVICKSSFSLDSIGTENSPRIDDLKARKLTEKNSLSLILYLSYLPTREAALDSMKKYENSARFLWLKHHPQIRVEIVSFADNEKAFSFFTKFKRDLISDYQPNYYSFIYENKIYLVSSAQWIITKEMGVLLDLMKTYF